MIFKFLYPTFQERTKHIDECHIVWENSSWTIQITSYFFNQHVSRFFHQISWTCISSQAANSQTYILQLEGSLQYYGKQTPFMASYSDFPFRIVSFL